MGPEPVSRGPGRSGILDGMVTHVDDVPVTAADDPRLVGMGLEDVAGADQLRLSWTPAERFQYFLDMVEFMEAARSARLVLRDG